MIDSAALFCLPSNQLVLCWRNSSIGSKTPTNSTFIRVERRHVFDEIPATNVVVVSFLWIHNWKYFSPRPLEIMPLLLVYASLRRNSYFLCAFIDVDRHQSSICLRAEWSLWRMQMIFNLISYLYFTLSQAHYVAMCRCVCEERGGQRVKGTRGIEACNLIWDSISWQLLDGDARWGCGRARSRKKREYKK